MTSLTSSRGLNLAVMVGRPEAPQHVHKRIAVEGIQSHSVMGAKGGVAEPICEGMIRTRFDRISSLFLR